MTTPAVSKTTYTAPFPYYGGKARLADWIVSHLPSGHLHYVEPFAGSLAVLLAKPPAGMETVNDLDGLLMAFWRVLRDQPDELERVCALTPHSRAEYAQTADFRGASDLELARRVWVQLTQGRSGTLRPTGWRTYQKPTGRFGMADYLASYARRIPAAAERIARVSLECRPALEVIGAYGRHDDVLMYCDPPYLGVTREWNYRTEMARADDHRELAAAVRSCRAAVVVSGYASPLYEELYAGWWRVEVPAYTGNGHGGRVEVLWSNRPLGEATLF